MISLSYHFHQNRQRERQALAKKANKDKKNVVLSSEETTGSNKDLTMSPREPPKLKKQSSTISVTNTQTRPSSTSEQGPGKSSADRKNLLKKTMSFDDKNTCDTMGVSQSIEDLSGLVTVRDISSRNKMALFRNNTSSTSEESADINELVSQTSSVHGALENFGQNLMETNKIFQGICLTKSESDNHSAK